MFFWDVWGVFIFLSFCFPFFGGCIYFEVFFFLRFVFLFFLSMFGHDSWPLKDFLKCSLFLTTGFWKACLSFKLFKSKSKVVFRLVTTNTITTTTTTTTITTTTTTTTTSNGPLQLHRSTIQIRFGAPRRYLCASLLARRRLSERLITLLLYGQWDEEVHGAWGVFFR